MTDSQMDRTLKLTDRQRERLDHIKATYKEADPGLPEPTDELVLKSLLDTWDAVQDGYYSEVPLLAEVER